MAFIVTLKTYAKDDNNFIFITSVAYFLGFIILSLLFKTAGLDQGKRGFQFFFT